MSEVIELFGGISMLLFVGILVYFIYQATRTLKSDTDYYVKKSALYEMVLDNVALKKGFDLNKFLLKKDIFNKSKTKMSKEIEREMLEEFLKAKSK